MTNLPVRFIYPSAAKLNLSLRVTAKRKDGYHDIVSLFLRLPPVETLSIARARDSDAVRVRGVEVEGENIVSRALRSARGEGLDVPFLDVEITKALYPGSGLGAGSGNGAAILSWLAEGDGSSAWRRAAEKTGADVPFLFSGHPLALASGTGEVLEPLEPLELYAATAFPDWSVGTENAYTRLDNWYKGVYVQSGAAALAEAERLCRELRRREKVGLLPNDFVPPLMDKFPDYDKLFDVFDNGGASAWGITGSGGAAFALFYEAPNLRGLPWPSWVRLVLSAKTP
jgi:4-diphosphocytidyl-2-C-methyl-D-erythritol kinase